MLHTDAQFESAVAARVEALEARTDAELVVVATTRSSAYSDVAALGASAFSLCFAAFLLLGPVWVTPIGALAELALGWGTVFWLLRRPALQARLLPRRLTRPRVLQAARAAFVEDAVHGTPRRIGLLIYVSAVEAEAVLIPDLGVEGEVPPAKLQRAARAIDVRSLSAFLDGLNALGDVLQAHLPYHPQPGDIDLPNAPRIRS